MPRTWSAFNRCLLLLNYPFEFVKGYILWYSVGRQRSLIVQRMLCFIINVKGLQDKLIGVFLYN